MYEPNGKLAYRCEYQLNDEHSDDGGDDDAAVAMSTANVVRDSMYKRNVQPSPGGFRRLLH